MPTSGGECAGRSARRAPPLQKAGSARAQRGDRPVVACTQRGGRCLGQWSRVRFLRVRFLRARPAVKILGISGFERAIPFKRAHWPGVDEREYRISQGHDSAAVLLVDGSIVAAVAEVRINRKKHTGAFPAGEIAYCLK